MTLLPEQQRHKGVNAQQFPKGTRKLSTLFTLKTKMSRELL